MYIHKKSDFLRDCRLGKIKQTEKVEAYTLYTGARCVISTANGNTQLKNGGTSFLNDKLSKCLVSAGITGRIIIHHKEISRSVPKWLTYNINNIDFDIWSKEIIVHVYDVQPKSTLPFDVVVMTTKTYTVDKLRDVIDNISINTTTDGLEVLHERDNVEHRYHLIPTRYCDGIIKGIINNDTNIGIVATLTHNGNEYITPITKVTNTMKSFIREKGEELIGSHVRVQYLSFINGDRLCNFSEPSALFIFNKRGT